MNTPDDPGSTPLSLDRRVDLLCDRFEADWEAGLRPRIEDVLSGIDEPARASAARELIAMEVELRRRRGEAPTEHEYLGRFPEFTPVVALAFGETARGEPDEGLTFAGDVSSPNRAEGETYETGPGHRFRILEAHARGGLGEVSLAFDRELGREVALKEIQLNRADDPASRARFLREAAITGRLEHPGIVPVYSLGRYRNGRPYYAMRMIRGRSLREAIADLHAERAPGRGPDPMGMRQVLRSFVAACQAIAFANSRGVIHRDLKPSNIMLGPFGETLVVDWGLAKIVGDGPIDIDSSAMTGGAAIPGVETLADTVLGTPAFMSPEQADGKPDQIGPAADVYGLGATLFTILTGHPPAGRPGHDSADLARPGRLDPTIPRPLEAVCLKAMATRPDDRYATATAMAEDVERWLADEPVSALPEPMADRVRRWLKRNRTLAASAIVALLVAAVAMTALAARERANLLQVREERDRSDAHLVMATEAIDNFREAVASRVDVRFSPELEPLRKELLGQPLGFYRRLKASLEADSTPRPGDRKRLIDACYRLAQLSGEIEPPDLAIASYREAEQMLRPVVEREPDDLPMKRYLARVFNGIANLQRASGRHDEALASHRKALPMFQELARREPQSTEALSDLGDSHNNIANVLAGMRTTEDALKAYRQALAIRRELVSLDPENTRAARDLAATLTNLGLLRGELGSLDEAGRDLDEARVIQETLAAGDPDDLGPRRDLAATLLNLGNVQRVQGQALDAVTTFEEAVAILSELANDRPAVLEFRTMLVLAQNNLGLMLGALGKIEPAIATLREALTIQEDLASRDPGNPRFQANLAGSRNALATILVENDRIAEGYELLEDARTQLETLLQQRPGEITLLRDLAGVLTNIGETHRALGKPEEAVPAFRSGIALQRVVLDRAPEIEWHRQQLSQHYFGLASLLRELRRPDEAAEATAARRALWDDRDPIELYNVACELALCIPLIGPPDPEPNSEPTAEDLDHRRLLADEAIEALRLAIGVGFESVAALRDDPDLDPIRHRDDFLAMVMDLAFPDDPFAR